LLLDTSVFKIEQVPSDSAPVSMSFDSILLNRYPILRTTNPEFARSQLLDVFGASSFDVSSIGLGSFKMRANYLPFGDVDLSFCAYDTEVTLGFGADRFVRQIFNIEGAERWMAGGRSADIAPGSSDALMPAQVPTRFNFGSDYRHLVLRIDTNSLRRYLGLLLGEHAGDEFAFN
jgi:AraC-binding-like domain